MPGWRRAAYWCVGLGGVAGAIGLLAWSFRPAGPAAVRPPATAAASGEASPLPALIAGARQADAAALAELSRRSGDFRSEAYAFDTAEAGEWIEALRALKAGFARYGPPGRARSIEVVGAVLGRFTVEPSPPSWSEALVPAHAILVEGIGDRDPMVRVAALGEVARLWSWNPGRSLLQVEEDRLASWLEGLHAPILPRLSDADPATRAAAVACLGALPIDAAAEPGAALVDDKSPEVRISALAAFAGRRELLPEENILPRLFDADVRVAIGAEQVLKRRGLNKQQIELGRMIFHPKPEWRAQAIPMLANRGDIDPIVWLLHLSRDPNDHVRGRAVEALAGLDSPAARRRLAEIGLNDPSQPIREAATKILAAGRTAQALPLPPLPGTPGLNPTAN